MGREFLIPVLVIWFLQAFAQVLNWTYWLQVKEYRLDRFEELLNNKEGWKNLEFSWILLKFATLFIALFFGLYFPSLVVLVVLAVKFFKETANRTLRKPVFTLRAGELLLTCGLGIILAIWAGYYTGIVATNLLVGEILIVICPALGVLWTQPLVEKSRRNAVQKARARIAKVRPLVIGVTGSYGKSTTKEFIAHILKSRYKTAKTLGNQNTDFGVARAAALLPKGTEVFVAEVGAYKRGEIARVAQFLKPQVAVVTGIEPQHLSLFGNMEDIKKAKYELVEGLSEDGWAVFNFGNEFAREMASWAKETGRKVYSFQVIKDNHSTLEKIDLTAKVVAKSPRKVTFEVVMRKVRQKITAPVRGVHFVENLAAAILVSRNLGVSWDQIIEACSTISSLEKTMTVFKIGGGATVIDDSYNSTPTAFTSALNYLSLFTKERKIVITSGIPELGSASKKVHMDLGVKMAHFVNSIIITNSDTEKSFKEGLGDKANILSLADSGNLYDRLKYLLMVPDNVILIEGRMPSRVVQLVQQMKQKNQ